MNAVDTNIWIYCHDTRDPEKQAKAKQLVASVRPMVLVWQVGCEFIAACRKLAPLGFTSDDAWDALADMQKISEKILVPEPQIWGEARGLQQRYTLSFWDSLLATACIRGGVQTLYTEDFGGSPEIDGMKIINPLVST